jgi:hypothetical protein
VTATRSKTPNWRGDREVIALRSAIPDWRGFYQEMTAPR